jgi:lysophospholipase L1-like esterase
MASAARENASLVAVNLALLLLASVAATWTYELYANSLAQHPEWVSTKATLKRGVMGAIAYQTDAQALARNRLDLGAWFGFQEVVYRHELDLAELDASIRFASGGYVSVLYDIGADGFSGIRFSDRDDMPSIHFRAQRTGRFIAADTLAPPERPAPDVWHAVRVAFAGNRVTVQLDGRTVGSFDRSDGPSRIGFRGGQREALVDDLEFHLTGGAAFRETFTNTRHFLLIALIVFTGFAALLSTGGLLARRRALPLRQVALGIAVANLVVIALMGILYAFQFVRPTSYPVIGSRAKGLEAYFIRSRQGDVLEDLQQQYGRPAGAGVYRILFLGASQTWGAGALLPEDVWVRQLETMLNLGARGRKFECLNAGVSGFTARSTAAFLDRLLHFGPQAAVIDLSSNDVDTVAFRVNLGRMVDTLMKRGIRTVLLLEANSPEQRYSDSPTGDLGVKHDIVRDIGVTRGVPVIDLQRYLLERNGTGFVWWDFVHLTSFGQRLVAEKLAADLPRLLDSNRR